MREFDHIIDLQPLASSCRSHSLIHPQSKRLGEWGFGSCRACLHVYVLICAPVSLPQFLYRFPGLRQHFHRIVVRCHFQVDMLVTRHSLCLSVHETCVIAYRISDNLNYFHGTLFDFLCQILVSIQWITGARLFLATLLYATLCHAPPCYVYAIYAMQSFRHMVGNICYAILCLFCVCISNHSFYLVGTWCWVIRCSGMLPLRYAMLCCALLCHSFLR